MRRKLTLLAFALFSITMLAGCVTQPNDERQLNRGASSGDIKHYIVTVNGAAVLNFPSGLSTSTTQPSTTQPAFTVSSLTATQSISGGPTGAVGPVSPGGTATGGAQGQTPTTTNQVTPQTTLNANLTPGSGTSLGK